MPVCDPFRQIQKQNLAQDLYDQFQILSGNTWFIGIGKVTEWLSATGANQDNGPPPNVDSVKSDTDFWRQILALKKVGSDDISFVVPRYDWQTGKVYDPYRDNVDLFDDENPAQFYVLVDDERVYKCIDNAYGSASVVAPTHTDYQIRTLSDGYRWKYLYSISDLKRPFLTTSQSNVSGYMPVEYLSTINENDQRILQWDVQQASVDGSIDYIDLDETIRSKVVSDKVVFAADENTVIMAPAGATSVTIAGPNIVLSNNYYNDFVLKIDSGMGAGQQRVIDQYIAGANSATVILAAALDYGVTGGLGSDASKFSIFPQIRIDGDGSSYDNIMDTTSTSAQVTAKFIASSVTGPRYIDSIEIVDRGRNYTYADVVVVSGLTSAAGLSADLTNLARAIMSPPGGHGSNPVKELGASSLMIRTIFSQDENDKLTIDNDYRQFSLIKNPLLAEKQIRLYFSGAGLSHSFTVGNTVTQGLTGVNGSTGFYPATGEIVEWNAGASGTTEMLLTNIDGTFGINGIINGLTAFSIVATKEKTVAGTEGRLLKRLKVVPVSSTFSSLGTDFTRNYMAIGIGNSGDNINPSVSTGRIYSWEPETATNIIGDLYLEDPNGNFALSEYISQMNYLYSGSFTPIAKITEIGESEIVAETIYDQTLKLRLRYDGAEPLVDTSFEMDEIVYGVSGATQTGSGYVIDWAPATGATNGTLRLINIQGDFGLGNNIVYNGSSTTGATIESIISTPEIEYRTGEIMFIQNLRPITRFLEQKEEIKLVIEY